MAQTTGTVEKWSKWICRQRTGAGRETDIKSKEPSVLKKKGNCLVANVGYNFEVASTNTEYFAFQFNLS